MWLSVSRGRAGAPAASPAASRSVDPDPETVERRAYGRGGSGPVRVAGVSKYHFARSFEASYGETPIRYLTRRRIERAQDLLRSANLTITEICVMVGFSSLGSFSARFSDLVGESPSAYRARWTPTGGPHIPGCYLFMWGLRPIEQSERSVADEAVRIVEP